MITENEDHVDHVIKETPYNRVFGYGDGTISKPKSEIIAVSRNVILSDNFPELFRYKLNTNIPLST